MDGRPSKLGLALSGDADFARDTSEAAVALRQLDQDGWIVIARTDSMDRELAGLTDRARGAQLLAESAAYPDSAGPFVLGQSLLDVGLIPNNADEARLGRVYRILFPGVDEASEGPRASERKLREAMHVATAVRDGADVFVTRDANTLDHAAELQGEQGGLRVMTPEDALGSVLGRQREYREQHPGS